MASLYPPSGLNDTFVYRPPQTPYLEILYQDEDLLVVNKPSGLLSVPGRLPEHKDSLMLRVQRVFPTAVVIHRLDMATSGLMVLALNRPAMSHLARQFQERNTEKHYTAWVEGQISSDGGVIQQPLICDWPNRPKQKICYEHGKPAQTLWRVLQREADKTLLQLQPITGRSHQLRVHTQHLGHPILGDQIYASLQGQQACSRLQLHASHLKLAHPATGLPIAFDSPAHEALEFFNKDQRG